MKSPNAIIIIVVGLIIAFMIMDQMPIISILCLLISAMLGLYARYKSINLIDNNIKEQDSIEYSDKIKDPVCNEYQDKGDADVQEQEATEDLKRQRDIDEKRAKAILLAKKYPKAMRRLFMRRWGIQGILIEEKDIKDISENKLDVLVSYLYYEKDEQELSDAFRKKLDAALAKQKEKKSYYERLSKEDKKCIAKEQAECKSKEEQERKTREDKRKKTGDNETDEKEEARKREIARNETVKRALEYIKAKEEAQRKAREEAQRKARKEAKCTTTLNEEEIRKLNSFCKRLNEIVEDNKRKSEFKEEAERKAREEAQRKAREEAQRKAREEAERKAREEAQRKAREEAQRKAREEAQRKAREEAQCKAREEAQRKAREEAQRKAREEAERRAREEEKKELFNKVSNWKLLFGELHYNYLLNYYPTTCDFEATQDEWNDRWTVWNFKNTQGKTLSSNHDRVLNNVIPQIKAKLQGTFGNYLLTRITLVCIPASSEEKTRARYEEFSTRLCSETGMINAYNHMHVISASQEKKFGGTGITAKNVDFESGYFNGKYVLLFDDIITKGESMLRFKRKMEELGAIVVAGFSIGRTKHERE